MSAWAWRVGACVIVVCALGACGSKNKAVDAGGVSSGGGRDAGPPKKARADAGSGDSGTLTGDATIVTKKDAGAKDAGPDAAFDPFTYDAAGDYNDAQLMPADAGPVPAGWTCPASLWADGYCDCGCSVTDVDCRRFSCIDPGCVDDKCEACFTLSGSWKPCLPDPSPSAWTCDAMSKSDSLCDCGCGIPDPACKGSGCSAPGCRTSKCDVRHGCSSAMTAADDDCSTVNPRVLTSGNWKCPWDRYGSGDGCDCGCGALDPDCGGLGGCSTAQCFDALCDRCNDVRGRPYSCDATKAGWDEDIIGTSSSNEPSQCSSTHFGSGDGCDCGCGGRDPDCGSAGCDLPGCSDAACKRCVDVNTLLPTGCAPTAPSTWQDSKCSTDHYGTGDGCDCGCGVPDPDCGTGGCTTAGCKAAACDVCNDGTGFFVQCDGWTCTNVNAFGDAHCDCGCGVVDPYCRDTHRQSCTGAGCETAACEYCNDSGGARTTCGGQWTSGNGGASSQCSLSDYGLDGLCDCGCGAHDPDCATGTDCTDKGCLASGCDVCHNGTSLAVCLNYRCDASTYGTGDGCDCGCGAPDPDCTSGGCKEPGCKDAACKVCHDPFGRALPCP
jgi:hypothetical protein